MDNKFLKEYFDKELELGQEYFRNHSPSEPTPPLTRFPKLKKPYTYAVIGKEAPLWPQMLCTGTLIVPLIPQRDEKQFNDTYGFSSEEIPELIQFSKETGRIQFLLEVSPTEFQNLPFLEPIFQELNPPMLLNLKRLDPSKKRDEAFDEICTIVDIFDSAYYTIWSEYPCPNASSQYQFNKRLFTDAYADLRDLGFDEIADEIISNILIDPYHATAILDVSEAFITGPILDPLQAQMSVNYERAVLAKKLLETNFDVNQSNIFPSEIGAFLLKKKSFNPKNFEDAQLALDIYSENQFYQVYNAFNDAIASKNYSILDSKIQNINEIFTQIWDESNRIDRWRESIQKPILFFNGCIGLSIPELVSRGVISPDMGFLYGLGFLGTSGLAGNYLLNDIPEYISRLIEKPYNITIYDFKHNLP